MERNRRAWRRRRRNAATKSWLNIRYRSLPFCPMHSTISAVRRICGMSGFGSRPRIQLGVRVRVPGRSVRPQCYVTHTHTHTMNMFISQRT
jgi:hypothetical protein